MKALGNVNMNAVEEYAEVSEKYQFLIKNRDDIKQSEEKLIGIIEQLNVLMEEQFREQFKVISDNFAETFKEMFGGGEAALKLSDAFIGWRKGTYCHFTIVCNIENEAIAFLYIR